MSCALKQQKQTTNEPSPITVSIPFVEGLSQEVCRIAYTTGVRCVFFIPNALCSFYTWKDQLPTDSITCAVYFVKCKMCSGEYVGKTLCVLRVRKKEHCDAIRLGQSSKSAIAEHVHEQSMPHEIDWQGMKAIDHASCRESEKLEKHFTFKSTNRNSIVTAMSNEAPFGMPLFDFC